ARIFPFQVVIAILFGDLLGRPFIALVLRHPDAAVVAEALAHERELRLVIAGDRYAGRVDLRVARMGAQGAALVRAPGRGDVRIDRVGRKVIDRAVAAGREDDGVRGVTLDRAGRQVTHDDAARAA